RSRGGVLPTRRPPSLRLDAQTGVETGQVDRPEHVERQLAPRQLAAGLVGEALDPRHHRQAPGLHELDSGADDDDLVVAAGDELAERVTDVACGGDVDVTLQLDIFDARRGA